MEVALGERLDRYDIAEIIRVLILVLMEVALGGELMSVSFVSTNCLNPCFNGSCSWSVRENPVKFEKCSS